MTAIRTVDRMRSAAMPDTNTAAEIVAAILPTDPIDDALPVKYHPDGTPIWGPVATVAEKIVAALEAAGRLLPEPVETREEWGVRNGVTPDYPVRERENPRMWAERDVRIGREYGGAAVLLRREIRDFGDRGTLTGPWVPVPEEGRTDG